MHALIIFHNKSAILMKHVYEGDRSSNSELRIQLNKLLTLRLVLLRETRDMMINKKLLQQYSI